MLTFFSVKNFRQFREELVFDFSKVKEYQFNTNCVKNGLVNKAIIYGKNAVGKTNLMEAMSDIYYTIRRVGFLGRTDISYRNADADEDETILFRYSFRFDDTNIDYQYEKTNSVNVVAEKLRIDDTVVFEYNRNEDFYDFKNVGIIGAEQLKWDEFKKINYGENDVEMMESLTALRFAYSNTVVTPNAAFDKLFKFISGMQFTVGFNALRSIQPFSLRRIAESEDDVQEFQNFLNEYGVKCKLIALQNADGEKNLFFDHKKPLEFFKNISSGTKLLTSFYFNFIRSRFRNSFIFIDEFDAYYHYELSEKIVKLIEENFDCQVVLTTHNTNLLSNSIMRPDCFMILHDGKITPIYEATNRELRQGHNLEKLYISGEFDAES